MGVADDSLRLPWQRAEEGAPVRRVRARERLRAPEPGFAGLIAGGAEDVEGDAAGGDSLALGVQGTDPEGQMIEQQRSLRRPESRPVGLEDDRREELDLVGDELAVVRLAQLAGLEVDGETAGAVAGDAGGLHVGGAGADRCERLGDPSGDEVVIERSLRTLVALEVRPQCSQSSRQASSRGRSSVKTCGLPRRGEHL